MSLKLHSWRPTAGFLASSLRCLEIHEKWLEAMHIVLCSHMHHNVKDVPLLRDSRDGEADWRHPHRRAQITKCGKSKTLEITRNFSTAKIYCNLAALMMRSLSAFFYLAASMHANETKCLLKQMQRELLCCLQISFHLNGTWVGIKSDIKWRNLIENLSENSALWMMWQFSSKYFRLEAKCGKSDQLPVW